MNIINLKLIEFVVDVLHPIFVFQDTNKSNFLKPTTLLNQGN